MQSFGKSNLEHEAVVDSEQGQHRSVESSWGRETVALGTHLNQRFSVTFSPMKAHNHFRE